MRSKCGVSNPTQRLIGRLSRETVATILWRNYGLWAHGYSLASTRPPVGGGHDRG